jgi:hypothetical protein
MKKYIRNKFWILAILVTASCVDPEDLVTEDAKEGGAMLSVAGSEGKLLGIEDPVTGIVTFTDNDLVLNVSLILGNFKGEVFTLVKQFNGQEIEVEEFTELPYEYSITTVAEFLDGFTGISASDLRIGDVISYKVKIRTSDGRDLYSNDAQISVTVNCGSDLAGVYTATGLYQRPLSSIVDSPFGPRTETILKYGVNYYGTQQTGQFTNASLGFEPCPIYFTVTCGIVNIPTQNLCNAYSNQVSGTGYVDEDSGDIYLEYQMTGGNLRTYTCTFVKQ